MRMNQNIKFKAEDVLNNYSEQKLSDIFFKYSNLKNSRKIAKTIIDNRKKSRISTTKELNSILKFISVKRFENKFLAKVYQALRIEVNNEIDSLKQVLYELPNVLNKNGRVVFITYHSVEDRLVKRFFKNGSFEKEPEKDCFGNTNLKFKIDFKFKSPSEEEIKSNHRSRSAKLRAAIKL